MSKQINLTIRIAITTATALLVLAHITYDYYNGGVPSHYIFQSDMLPGLSNWLGIIILPLLTWLLLHRINKRLNKEELRYVLFRFAAALFLGVLFSYLFTQKLPGIDYIMIGLFGVALFTPLYKSEYLLGYVLGTGYTFGVAIPAFFGALLLGIYAIIYCGARWVISKLK